MPIGYALVIVALVQGAQIAYLVSDPIIPPGQEGGPSVTPVGCAVKAMTEGPKWMERHVPGAEFVRAICVQTDSLDSMQLTRALP
ncbi:MAG: hypothetical protein WCF16_13640 [Alphaproteobacteria bacterium]